MGRHQLELCFAHPKCELGQPAHRRSSGTLCMLQSQATTSQLIFPRSVLHLIQFLEALATDFDQCYSELLHLSGSSVRHVMACVGWTNVPAGYGQAAPTELVAPGSL